MTGARRVGVIGGTFDPIHVGHLTAARAAADSLALEAMIFMPASDPPHRPDKPRASGYHRLQMVTLAVAGVPGWRASDLELARQGASYTFDTLTALGADEGGTSQLFFILGADAFAEIATWYRYPAVLDLATFVVIARPGVQLAATTVDPNGGRGEDRGVRFIHAETPNVSATEIRRRVGAGESIHGLVPEAVEQYIAANRLYGFRGHESRV